MDEKYNLDNLEITLVSAEKVMDSLIKRKILVTDVSCVGGEQREVIHMQYLSWPDHGAPEESDNKIIMKLLDSMKEH